MPTLCCRTGVIIAEYDRGQQYLNFPEHCARAGLPSLLGGSANPLLQNLVITKEDLTSLAATLGLPAPGETAALGAAGLDPAAILAQSLAETKAEVNNIFMEYLN